jgi:cytochrome c-type biogenesis protein CcmH
MHKLRSAISVAACSIWLSSGASAQPASVRATTLQARLFAPCCYSQTLEVHESELAGKLRAEVGRRIGRGESDLAIENDLVERYGERMRALPREHASRWYIPLIAGIALSMTLILAGCFALRWRRRELQRVSRDQMSHCHQQ